MKPLLYFLTSLVLLSNISCKKSFLDVDENSSSYVYRQTYVRDLITMQHFMNGIYIQFDWFFEHGYHAAYPEIAADNMKPASITATTLLLPHYGWTQVADETAGQAISTTTQNMNPLWRIGYSIIRACSFVINDIDRYRAENPLLADNIAGQAYALRAYMNFKLVNTFAQGYVFTADASHIGIPVVTTPDITASFSRQTVKEVYDAMISDYTKAVEILPASITDTRFMNRAAAKALLARAYLFKGDYTNAKMLAIDIANQFPLMTIANGYPVEMYKFRANPAQTESLFQLSPQTNSYVTSFLGQYTRRNPIRFAATDDIASVLKERPADVRATWVSYTAPTWNILKFPSGVAPEVTPAINPAETAYYPVIIRSSEMFLTAAEACAKTGSEDLAKDYLNAIRRRALPSIPDIVASGPALLDSIYKERRKELAFESLRLFDLQRLKKGVNRTDTWYPTTAKDLPYPSDKAIAPIPQRDVILGGISQNEGY